MQMQTITCDAQQTAAIVSQSGAAIALFLPRHGPRYQKCSNVRRLAATCSCIVWLGGGGGGVVVLQRERSLFRSASGNG